MWLAQWPLVLDVPGSMPAGGEKTLVVRTRFPSFHWQLLYYMNTVRRPSDRAVDWSPPVQGQSSPVLFKVPYKGSVVMHVGSCCKHTGVYRVHLPRIFRNRLMGVTGKQNKLENYHRFRFIV